MKHAAWVVACVLVVNAARGQGCEEPSALDLLSGAEPLRVSHANPRQLHLTWENLGTAWRVHAGTLASLHGLQAYDHAPLIDTSIPEAIVAADGEDSYFLVAGSCGDPTGDSSAGRDSVGNEIPAEGDIIVVTAVADAANVVGVQVVLHWNAADMWVGACGLEWVGPLAPGAPGNPSGMENLGSPGVASMAALFSDPGAYFDAPAAPPVAIAELALHHGLRVGHPDQGEITSTGCVAVDAYGASIPTASCLVAEFRVVH